MNTTFTAKEVLAFALKLCPKHPLKNLSIMPNAHRCGLATGEQKKGERQDPEFVLCCHQRWPHILGFRAILRIKRLNQRYTYLINGQAGKNTESVLAQGESGPVLTPSHQRMREMLRSEAPDNERFAQLWQTWMTGAGARAHETEFQIIQNLGYTDETIIDTLSSNTNPRPIPTCHQIP